MFDVSKKLNFNVHRPGLSIRWIRPHRNFSELRAANWDRAPPNPFFHEIECFIDVIFRRTSTQRNHVLIFSEFLGIVGLFQWRDTVLNPIDWFISSFHEFGGSR
jgi:hypothetical protein